MAMLLISMQLACRCNIHAVLKATPEHAWHIYTCCMQDMCILHALVKMLFMLAV